MRRLEHDALLYDGTDDFVEHLLPFVRGGLERGDGVLAVVPRERAAALREALGTDAALVDWGDWDSWYGPPGPTLARFLARLPHDGERPFRVIGEPPPPADSEVSIAEWARYEAAANEVLADVDAWIVCPYDTAALPEEVVEHARRTHPALHERGRRNLHVDSVDPVAYWQALDEAVPLAPPPRARLLPLTPDLAGLRAAVAAEASAAGVAADGLPPLLLAVHELAINALTHGGGDGEVRTWAEAREFVCEVADRGPGGVPPFAGYRRAGDDAGSGRGIWLARQLCDYVEVRSGEQGTRARVRVRRS